MIDESLNRVARVFGIQVESAERVGGGFSAASVFRVTSSDGRAFAVRKTPEASAIPSNRLNSLNRLLKFVSANGVSVVPIPIPPDGTLALTWPLSDSIEPSESWIRLGTDLWQAEPWMPGEPLSGQPTETQIRSGLQCLVAFHEAAKSSVSTLGQNEWFHVERGISPGVLRRLSIATELHEGLLSTLRSAVEREPDPQFRSLASRVCTLVQRWLPDLLSWLTPLSQQRFLLQPVIRDLWRAHLLFTCDSVTGLIDLSSAASDHVCFDLARLLRSWFQSDLARILNTVKSFAVLHSLDPSERKLLQALDASTVLLSPVTWLRRRFESTDNQPCSPEILSRLTELTQIAEAYQPMFE